MEFNYHLPVNLIFGRGSVGKIGDIAADYGTCALIVTGCGSTKKSGLLDRVTGYLQKAGVSVVLFDKVKQNPLTTTAMEAAALAKEHGCEMVIGLGGGSIMDCAKAAAFLAVNDGDINDYIFGRQKSDDALPIILVPTTCGTGSEGNGFAVLTNPENGDKKSLRCNAIVASASIIDSECMMTMPKNILASVGFDALCHCIEAYISKIAQPLTDMMSVHGMEHPASGLKNIVHGRGLAALTPVVMEETIRGCENEADRQKFAKISQCLGGKDETDCVEQIKKLLERLHLTTTLTELGIEAGDVDWMTENCMKVSAAGISYHPVTFGKNQIHELYEKAL